MCLKASRPSAELSRCHQSCVKSTFSKISSDSGLFSHFRTEISHREKAVFPPPHAHSMLKLRQTAHMCNGQFTISLQPCEENMKDEKSRGEAIRTAWVLSRGTSFAACALEVAPCTVPPNRAFAR